MEKYRTITARKYLLLSSHRWFYFKGHKKYEQSLIVSVTNNGGSISFTFTDLATNEVKEYKDVQTGEFVVFLTKGNKMKLVINASKAFGAYKIVKKTIKE